MVLVSNQAPQPSSNALIALSVSTESENIVRACSLCGLLHCVPLSPATAGAGCIRCGAHVWRAGQYDLFYAFVCALAGVILLFLVIFLPLLEVSFEGKNNVTSLYSAVSTLWHHRMIGMAALVFFTLVLVPAMQLLFWLCLLFPLCFRSRTLAGSAYLLRTLSWIAPWNMLEIFLLGVLVSFSKLSSIAIVFPDSALWLLAGVVLMFSGVSTFFHSDAIWHRIKVPAVLADLLGRRWFACRVCHWLQAAHQASHCERCGKRLYKRQKNSVNTAWAYLIAAAFLYIPANVLPMMITHSLFDVEADTIASGIIVLWEQGSWPLALLIFFASVVVPLLKFIALGLLLYSVQHRLTWRPLQRTRLYCLLELVGRWSMLDLYVLMLLVSLVQFRFLANIEAGPAAPLFAAVVVLTILAVRTFDPRLIWDPIGESSGQRA